MVTQPNRRMAAFAQGHRRAELDTIRLARPLTAAEQAEADTLTARLYMREWRRSIATPPQRSTSHAA